MLDDAEMSIMVEPYPGTQVIYEFITTCGSMSSKVFPPNSTLILSNRCTDWIFVLGEVKKLVVLENNGEIDFGDYFNQTYTEEVVIQNNFGVVIISNKTKAIEIQGNDKTI